MIQLPPEHEAIAQRVVELLRDLPTPDVMTRREAMVYVKRRSEGAFCEWCQRWRVKPVSRGRYSRNVLDLALAREAGTVRTPASMRSKAA